MAGNMFLLMADAEKDKAPMIDFFGSVLVKGFEDQILIDSMLMECERRSDLHSTTPVNGVAKVSDLVLTKTLDHSSIGIMKYCLMGWQIPYAKLSCCMDKGDNPPVFMSIEMANVLVSSTTTGGNEASAGRFAERITLTFQSLRTTYYSDTTVAGSQTKKFNMNLADKKTGFAINKTLGSSLGKPA
jgi:type VI secretion system secreted protein Hcp